MSLVSEYTVGGLFSVVSILLIVLKSYELEFIVNIVKMLFKSKTDKFAIVQLNAIIIILLVSGILIISYGIKTQASQTNDININMSKSDAEVFLEGAELAIELIEDGIEEHRIKNEEIVNNRGERWVIQIGNVRDNKESVFKEYLKLKSIEGINHSKIYVFENRRNTYILYYDMFPTESDKEKQLQDFKEKIEFVEIRVKLIDLHEYCKASERIENSKPLKYRKYVFKIPRCKCNK